MKLNIKIFITILFFIFFGKNNNAQDCPNSNQVVTINGVRNMSTMGNGGSVFGTDLNYFTGIIAPVPSPGFPEVVSISNQNIWIGSQSSNGSLKLSVLSPFQNDFAAGPIFIENTPPTIECIFYNKIWKVTGEEITLHISDFNDNGIIDQPIENIYNYPGSQNPFFFFWNGFNLPNTNQPMAPFFDQNGDGTYNPEEGDFPLPEGVSEQNIPLEMAWTVSNDVEDNFIDSAVDSLMIELQSTMWTFFCEEDPLLDLSIFTSQKIINHGNQTLDSVKVGYSSRSSLGCSIDDYVGCIPEQNTFYHYNQDSLDGSTGCSCVGGVPTYCQVPPVQSITFLNQEMSSFIFHGQNGDQNYPFSNLPELPIDFWNLMNSQWSESPLTFGENGINNTNPITNFAFPDHPIDPQGWSMNNNDTLLASNNLGYLHSIASISIGDIPPGASERIDMVYTFYQSDSLDNLETINLVYENTPLLQQKHDNNYDLNCGIIVSNMDQKSANHLIEIFPNPTSDILNIKMENPSRGNFSIFDIYGKKVLEKSSVNQNKVQISAANFSQGVYFLKIEMKGKEFVKKFVKI